MKNKEKGITLVALIITIMLLIILISIGYTVGNSTIESANFIQFKNELQLMQNKIDELNQGNKVDIGQELTDDQKSILNKKDISDIIYNGKTEQEKTKIQNGFRYFSQNFINTELNLDSVRRNYLINVEYRYVIFPDGFKDEGITYYMIDQIEDGIYNVRYNDKNEKSGSFEVNAIKENNKYKVQISNIQYNGYVDKWQVKYKLEDSSYWETSDNLTFYLREEGKYSIKVVHGDEIDLGSKELRIYDEYNLENLILHYDAINNDGKNEHNLSTTIWKDLSNSNNDAQINGATWSENYLSFDGVNDFAVTNNEINFNSSKEATIEFVDLNGSLLQNNFGNVQIIFEMSDNWNMNNNSFGLDIGEYSTKSLALTFHSQDIKYNIKRTQENILTNEEVNLYTVVVNTNEENNNYIKIYINGKLEELSIIREENISNVEIANNIMYFASRAGNSYFTKINLGALRVYNKELTQKQIQNNYEIDKIRFKK